MSRPLDGERRLEPVLALYSRLAFYPIHWLALRELVRRYTIRAIVLAAPSPPLSRVHRALGAVQSEDESIEIRRMPAAGRLGRVRWLRRQLAELRPDAIWLQEEPTDPFVLEVLALLLRDRHTRIACAVCENVFDRLPPPLGVLRSRLWGRLDVLLGVASPSLVGIRRAGMPDSVPARALVAGALAPAGEVEPADLGLRSGRDDFVVGYAGNLTDQKGWHVLADAVGSLPTRFKLAVAGDGPQRRLLETRLAQPDLGGRSTYVGLLAKEDLWSFYRALDTLVVPSLTQPRLVEQFGGVLADGMVMGLPLVGSSSGAIPEVMGDAGVVVAEGDRCALAATLERLGVDDELRSSLALAGPPRFRREFAIPVYADKIAEALRLKPRSLSGADYS